LQNERSGLQKDKELVIINTFFERDLRLLDIYEGGKGKRQLKILLSAGGGWMFDKGDWSSGMIPA
jgi:hypothetical protein